METIIPILIAIVIFAFQAYSNYQKEQEKARKRNLGQPPLPEDNADRPMGEYWDEPVVETIPTERYPPVTSPQPSSVQRRFEKYSGVMDTGEATRINQTRQRPVIPRRLAVNEEAQAQTSDVTKFDLRDAIIKSVILERPYQ
jgi:hypothetical protein